jgi:hypothetical protein
MGQAAPDDDHPMSLRTATFLRRQRKNIMFEQERIASLDDDAQRASDVKAKKPTKKKVTKAKDKKSSH